MLVEILDCEHTIGAPAPFVTNTRKKVSHMKIPVYPVRKHLFVKSELVVPPTSEQSGTDSQPDMDDAGSDSQPDWGVSKDREHETTQVPNDLSAMVSNTPAVVKEAVRALGIVADVSHSALEEAAALPDQQCVQKVKTLFDQQRDQPNTNAEEEEALG